MFNKEMPSLLTTKSPCIKALFKNKFSKYSECIAYGNLVASAFHAIISNKEDFSDSIKRISENKESFSYDKAIERQNAVKSDSWGSRADEMINLINYGIIK